MAIPMREDAAPPAEAEELLERDVTGSDVRKMRAELSADEFAQWLSLTAARGGKVEALPGNSEISVKQRHPMPDPEISESAEREPDNSDRACCESVQPPLIRITTAGGSLRSADPQDWHVASLKPSSASSSRRSSPFSRQTSPGEARPSERRGRLSEATEALIVSISKLGGRSDDPSKTPAKQYGGWEFAREIRARLALEYPEHYATEGKPIGFVPSKEVLEHGRIPEDATHEEPMNLRRSEGGGSGATSRMLDWQELPVTRCASEQPPPRQQGLADVLLRHDSRCSSQARTSSRGSERSSLSDDSDFDHENPPFELPPWLARHREATPSGRQVVNKDSGSSFSSSDAFSDVSSANNSRSSSRENKKGRKEDSDARKSDFNHSSDAKSSDLGYNTGFKAGKHDRKPEPASSESAFSDVNDDDD